MHATCLIIFHDLGMRPGPESNWGPLDIRLSVKLKCHYDGPTLSGGHPFDNTRPLSPLLTILCFH